MILLHENLSTAHFKITFQVAVWVFDWSLLLHNLPVGICEKTVWFEHANGPLLGIVDPLDCRGNRQSSSIGYVTHSKSLEEKADSGGVEEQRQDNNTSSMK